MIWYALGGICYVLFLIVMFVMAIWPNWILTLPHCGGGLLLASATFLVIGVLKQP